MRTNHRPTGRWRPGSASRAISGALLAVTLVAAAAAVPAPAAAAPSSLMAGMEVVTVAADGGPANGASTWSDVSGDGTVVAFSSEATNLVTGDARAYEDVFVRDSTTAKTTLVSRRPGGGPANGRSGAPRISRDGRFVVYQSVASNLVPGDDNGYEDVFLFDRLSGETELITVSLGGGVSNRGGMRPSVSGNGRYVSYFSASTDLVDDDTNSRTDVFLRDRVTGTTALISRTPGGSPGNDHSDFSDLSGNGKWVAYSSRATDLVRNDRNGTQSDVFRYEVSTGTSTLISKSTAGEQSDGVSYLPQISDDGNRVAYSSTATNLDLPSKRIEMIYTYDATNGTTLTASRTPDGEAGNGWCEFGIAVSGDGRKVAFACHSNNLAKRDTNGDPDVFVFDPATLRVRLVSRALDGQSGDNWSDRPSLNRTGRLLTFASDASDLTDQPEGEDYDILRRSLAR